MAAEGTHHSPASDIEATVAPGTGWDSSGLAKETGGNLAALLARVPAAIGPTTILAAGDMTGNLAAVQNVGNCKCVSIRISAPLDTHAGSFAVLFSMDGLIANATQVTLSQPLTVTAGVAVNIWVDIATYGPYLHVAYTAAAGTGTAAIETYAKG